MKLIINQNSKCTSKKDGVFFSACVFPAAGIPWWYGKTTMYQAKIEEEY